ncbi:putative PB1 domain-containing protein [Helianthus annuus]|nr:putative PB1 domain-containing protein [Helianthus annuus]
MQEMKQNRKRKIDLVTMEAVEQHVGKLLDQTAQILGGKSSYLFTTSTLERFVREHGRFRWPVPKHSKISDFVTNPKLSQVLWSEKHLQQSLPRSVGHASDTGLLTVKASFKGDIIKFRFSVSSGLVELEKEVAKRMRLKGQKFKLKYEDEDKDLLLITCDADLESLAGYTTIKLLVYLADDDQLAFETSHSE